MEDVLLSLVWAFLIFIVETVLLWKFGENIQYGIIYSLNRREKSMRNVPININYFRTSQNFIGNYKYDDIFTLIKKCLTNNDIIFDAHSSEILINNYEYGSSQLNGKIYFTYKNFENNIIMNINYEFSKLCNYNTFSDEIFGLVKSVKDLQDKISSTLPENTMYADTISCKLSNMKSLTKFFEAFKEKKGYE